METDKVPQEVPIAQTPLENEPVYKSVFNQKGNFLLILGVVVIILVLFGAGGYLLTMNKNSNSNQYTPQPTPISTQPTSSNETANWKTYTSQTYNFSVKYPNNWQTYALGDIPQDEPSKEAPKQYFALVGTNEKILLEVIPSNTTTVRNIVSSLFDTTDNNRSNSGMTVDGYGAQVVENPNGKPRIAVVFEYQNYIYKFQTDDNVKNTLVQMLSTFQFGGERTGFKTYTSKYLNFSVQIPARWKVNEQEGNQEGSYYEYRTINFTAPVDDKDLTPFTINVTHKDYKQLFPDYNENYTIAGIPAYRVSPAPGQNAPYEEIVFKKGNDTYVILRFKFYNNDTILNKILSTFKFTN